MTHFGARFNLAMLCCLIFSCSHLDKASRQRWNETMGSWYRGQRPGSVSRHLSTDLLFQARNDRYLDSFPVLHRFNFDRQQRFTQFTDRPSKRKKSFYAGAYQEKADTIFLRYYQDAHPDGMAPFLLKDTARKVLLYPVNGTGRRVPLEVRYTIFVIR